MNIWHSRFDSYFHRHHCLYTSTTKTSIKSVYPYFSLETSCVSRTFFVLPISTESSDARTHFGIVALAQPRWGFEWQEVQQKGTDIIIALDVSQSMLAEDVSPNRLIRAKREIIDFLQIVEGDRIRINCFCRNELFTESVDLRLSSSGDFFRCARYRLNSSTRNSDTPCDRYCD